MPIPPGDLASSITPVGYRPVAGHRLDVEVYAAAELARRVLTVPQRGIERVDLLCMLYVSEGSYEHMVDFVTYRCTAGTAITVHPGQVHRFGAMTAWDGWFVVVRPERTGSPGAIGISDPGGDHGQPVMVHVPPPIGRAVEVTIRQMSDDTRRGGETATLNALLLHQLRSLSARLQLAAGTDDIPREFESIARERFRAFRVEVEHGYTRWRGVAPYAGRIGCSARTLTRACEAVTGLTAKEYVTNRVVLEAKRLLVHNPQPVATIADALGFDEPTNFVKYFRRETGLTPGAFRSRFMDPGARTVLDGDRSPAGVPALPDGSRGGRPDRPRTG